MLGTKFWCNLLNCVTIKNIVLLWRQKLFVKLTLLYHNNPLVDIYWLKKSIVNGSTSDVVPSRLCAMIRLKDHLTLNIQQQISFSFSRLSKRTFINSTLCNQKRQLFFLLYRNATQKTYFQNVWNLCVIKNIIKLAKQWETLSSYEKVCQNVKHWKIGEKP